MPLITERPPWKHTHWPDRAHWGRQGLFRYGANVPTSRVQDDTRATTHRSRNWIVRVVMRHDLQ